jgi:hypothetical protein
MKFIKPKIQSRILLVYVAICVIYVNVSLSLLPYLIIKPDNKLDWFISIAIGIAIFLFLALLISGFFVYDAAKQIEKESFTED